MSGALPHNLEAERAVLGTALVHREAASMALDLDDDAFFADDHRRIFATMRKVAEAGGKPNAITVCDAAMRDDGGVDPAYVTTLMDGLPRGTGHMPSLIALLRQHQALRMAASLGSEMADAALSGDLDHALRCARDAGSISEIPLERCAAPTVAEYAEAGESSKVRLGWRRLDERCGGGVPRGDVFVVLACPGVGKTTWALRTADQVMEQVPDEHVVFVSLEMPRVQLIERHLMGWCNVTTGELRANVHKPMGWPTSETPKTWEAHAEHYRIMRGTRSIEAIRAELARLDRPIGLIVIDHLQRMEAPGGEKRSLYEQTTRISRALKPLAEDHDCAVIALSQMHRGERGGPDRVPSLRDARDTGAIEEDADYMLGLYRPNWAQDLEGGSSTVQLGAVLLKCRHGQPGAVPYEYDLPRQTLWEVVPKPTQEELRHA